MVEATQPDEGGSDCRIKCLKPVYFPTVHRRAVPQYGGAHHPVILYASLCPHTAIQYIYVSVRILRV